METQTITIPATIGANLVQIIDVAQKRGTFEGNEMLGVATTRQALVDTLNAIEAKQAKAAEAEQMAETATRKVLGSGQ